MNNTISAAYYSYALTKDGSVIRSRGDRTGAGIVTISARERRFHALTRDGKVIGWGYNTYSPPGNNFVAISAGYERSLALTRDGRVVGWGWSLEGHFHCPPGNNFVAISAGEDHWLALTRDGKIVGWGYNMGGALFNKVRYIIIFY